MVFCTDGKAPGGSLSPLGAPKQFFSPRGSAQPFEMSRFGEGNPSFSKGFFVAFGPKTAFFQGNPNLPIKPSPRLRRRQRRLLAQELAQGLDAGRTGFVGTADEVIAEGRRDAGLKRRDQAPGGELVGGDRERG